MDLAPVALTALAGVLLAGGLVWRARRAAARRTDGALGHRTTWLPTRDGLVCFSPEVTALYPWDAVGRVEAHGDRVQLELHTSPPPWVTRHGGPGPAPSAGRRSLHAGQLGDRDPRAFVEAVRGACADPSVRAGLPTFAHPDGPPEAVLAGLPDA